MPVTRRDSWIVLWKGGTPGPAITPTVWASSVVREGKEGGEKEEGGEERRGRGGEEEGGEEEGGEEKRRREGKKRR